MKRRTRQEAAQSRLPENYRLESYVTALHGRTWQVYDQVIGRHIVLNQKTPRTAVDRVLRMISEKLGNAPSRKEAKS